MKIILVGGNKTIYFLAKHFVGEGHAVTIVNNDMQDCRELSHQLDATVVFGDGTDSQALEEANAQAADVFLALTSKDHVNLTACQVANEIFHVPRTIGFVNNPDNEEVFRKLGLCTVFSATRIITSLLHQQANFMAITELMAVAEGQVNISQLQIPENAPAAGKNLKELNPPEGFVIAAIIRGGKVFIPRGASVITVNDQLVVIGETDGYEEFLRLLIGR